MYRPIVVLSYFINYNISGYSAYSYYIFNFLIHCINVLILIKIVQKILIKKHYHSPAVPIYLGFIFFILPQNLTNIFWIAGRTDLLVTFFLLMSILFLIKYISESRNFYIYLAILFQIFSFMSKETAVIFIVYWIFIYILHKENITRKKQIIIISTAVTLIMSYIIFRFAIFGLELMGDQKYVDLSFYGIIKYSFYSLFSLLVPFDLLDIFYLLGNSITFLIIGMVVIISLLYLFFKLFVNSPQKWVVFWGIALTLLSLLIYLGSYPQMRLMYAHLPFLIISISMLIASSGAKARVFISIFILISITASTLLIYRNSVIQYHMKSLLSAIPSSENYENDSKYLLLPALGRVGQTWSRPSPNPMYTYKTGKDINQQEVSNFIVAVVYETYSFTKYKNLIDYKMLRKNVLQISIRDGCGILVPEASEKFNTSFDKPEGVINIEPINYSKYRPYAATVCNITLDTTKNINIIYWDGTKYSLKSKDEFIKWVKNKTQLPEYEIE